MTSYAFGMDKPTTAAQAAQKITPDEIRPIGTFTAEQADRKITPDEIRRIGIALYGPARGWKKALAERLGARQETISRWLRGQPVSNAYARLLRSLK